MPASECGARKKDGEPCRAAPIRGGTRCRRHGGASPQALRAAQRRNTEAELKEWIVNLGEPEPIDPGEALLKLIAMKHGEVLWLREKVKELPEDGLSWGIAQHEVGLGPEGPIDKETRKAQPHVLWTLLRQAEDQLAAYAAKALTAGIEERRVRLAEQQGTLVATAIRRILDRLQLTPTQLSMVSTIVPEELRTLAP